MTVQPDESHATRGEYIVDFDEQGFVHFSPFTAPGSEKGEDQGTITAPPESTVSLADIARTTFTLIGRIVASQKRKRNDDIGDIIVEREVAPREEGSNVPTPSFADYTKAYLEGQEKVLEARMAALDERIIAHAQRTDDRISELNRRIDDRIREIGGKIDQTLQEMRDRDNQRHAELLAASSKLDSVVAEVRQSTRWAYGTVTVLAVTTIVAVAGLFLTVLTHLRSIPPQP